MRRGSDGLIAARPRRASEDTKAMMAGINIPWITYKVLDAGRMEPEPCCRHAVEAGAGCLHVAMFDFQVAENADLVGELTSRTQPA
jgi:hypothetical protein